MVDVYLVDIKPLPSTLFEQRAELELRFQNLSERPIQANGVNVRLIVNDRRLARGVDNRTFTIPPLADATTRVAVSSGLFDAVRQLLAIPGRETFSYDLAGRLYSAGLDRRFRRSGELTREDLAALAPQQ